MSLQRFVTNVIRTGPRYFFRQMLYHCDPKSGTFIGRDEFGNRYFQNLNAEEEVPGRHRWVDLNQDQYQISQIPPEWHSWLNHIRELPPPEDPILKACTPTWKQAHRETLTGTRGAYKPYSTVGPKIIDWTPKVSARGGGRETVDGA
ncbi:NDUFA12-domain-containing protein [Mrakia frigida]|uniref:complex I NDUFA12 subunit family protein n=1 Tax=Mrakia frigida TaxID=29902 RepID=UPI003FCBF639